MQTYSINRCAAPGCNHQRQEGKFCHFHAIEHQSNNAWASICYPMHPDAHKKDQKND